jgi:hypothetical protein
MVTPDPMSKIWLPEIVSPVQTGKQRMPNSPVAPRATVLPVTVPYTVLGTYTYTGCAARGKGRASVAVAPQQHPVGLWFA